MYSSEQSYKVCLKTGTDDIFRCFSLAENEKNLPLGELSKKRGEEYTELIKTVAGKARLQEIYERRVEEVASGPATSEASLSQKRDAQIKSSTSIMRDEVCEYSSL